jgi:hypothetical protein
MIGVAISPATSKAPAAHPSMRGAEGWRAKTAVSMRANANALFLVLAVRTDIHDAGWTVAAALAERRRWSCASKA